MTESHNFEINIRMLREKFPQSSQIGFDGDFCLIDIRRDEERKPENFAYPCRLDGNIMLFCVKGSVRLSVNLNEYQINEGQMVVCSTGDIVAVSQSNASGDMELHLVMLAMSHRFASDLRIDFKRILNDGIIPVDTPIISIDAKTSDIVGDHLKLIAKIASDKGEMYKDSVRSLTSSMISVLAGQWLAEIGDIRARKAADPENRSNHKRVIFEHFMKLVTENYSEHRQVTFYADKLCLSPKYLSKSIKDVSGKSAPEWIDANVMLEAKHLLKYSDMTIKEIVYRLNFPSQTAFYKYFKAHTGMTPTDYRNS